MRVLFSPSESKSSFSGDKVFSKDSVIFPEFFDKRIKILNLYDNFIKTADIADVSRLFGIKNIDDNFRNSVLNSGCIKAVLRYDGVAYNALNYRSLNKNEQLWIDDNVMIFSNLFGPVLAGDSLPDYKLKQGQRFENINIEKYYKDNFSLVIDEWLKGHDVLDLRAGFYLKFYELRQPYITFKFIKDGKVVSHYAKAYRGKLLSVVAKSKINTVNDLLNIDLIGLKLEEIIKSGLKTEIIVKIMQ